jgi:hypothetical protein
MSQDQNPFGGKNPHGVYVPMTETEQELLSRLVERDDLVVVVKDWGIVFQPGVKFGDHRVSVMFRLSFDRPSPPIPVYYFDLELKTRAGVLLYAARQSLVYDNQPMLIGAGLDLDLAWDIAIHHMDPKVVKALMPSAIGLTSRRIDKDTGEATAQGNMQLDSSQKKLLNLVTKGEERIRKMDAERLESESPKKAKSR